MALFFSVKKIPSSKPKLSDQFVKDLFKYKDKDDGLEFVKLVEKRIVKSTHGLLLNTIGLRKNFSIVNILKWRKRI